ncbi:MAG: PorV/PorQ family protein [bacterium]
MRSHKTSASIYMILRTAYAAALCAFLFFTPPLLLAKGTGGQPGQFLSWGAGARSLAMGKAFLAVSDDASATYWNPAGLTQLDRKEIMALHAILFADTSYSFLSYVHPTATLGVFGCNFTRLFSGGFEKIQIKIDPASQDIVELNKMGTFDNVQQALTLAYGKDILDVLSLGVATKFIQNTLDTSSNSFFALDTSLMIKEPLPNYKFALSFQNLLAQTMGDSDDKLPINFRIGNSYRALKDKLLLALDIDKSMKANMGWHVGIEYWLIKFAAIRLGFEGESGIRETAAGFGLKYRDYGFDYAFALHELGMSSRISGSWRFGKSVKESKMNEVRLHIQKGFDAFIKGNYLIAVSELTQALDIDPTNNDVKEMASRLQSVISYIPSAAGETDEIKLIRKGVSSYVNGDNRTALNALRYAYNKNPSNEKLLYMLNKIEANLGESKTEKPRVSIAGFTLVDQKIYDARQAMYEGKYDQALKRCQEVLDIEPNNVTSLELMGSAFFLIDQKDKARAIWERALEIDPNNKVIPEFLKQIK